MKSELTIGINIGRRERAHQSPTRLLACLGIIVIALTCGHTAVAQQNNQSATDYQHRQNVSACESGWGRCDESLLTPAETAQLAVVRHRQNVSACESGWGRCDESLLTPAENTQLAVVHHRQTVLSTPVTAPVAENGSYYGELNANGVPKTVSVQGYTRSDGTYVRGYYRSAPGTNPIK
jgi:hypothetical protein